MNGQSERGPAGLNEAQERFALYLSERASDPNLSIEDFARRTPHLEDDLKRLFVAWSSARAALSATSDAARTSDLEFGYEVVEELGRGGFGRVLRARNRGLDTEVAIKVVDGAALSIADARERFVDEARRLAKVVHENVVRVFDVHAVERGEDAGKLRLVLELVRGRTLAQVVEQDGPLSCAEAAQVGMAVCRGLAAIHGRGLVHLDVKPSNLMRAAGGRIVLLDFGFARELAPGAGAAAPVHGGTPPFMAPEHLAGAAEVGPAADLYSLGVTLYWMVAGRYPFDTADRGAMFQSILDGRLVPLLDARPDVDPDFAALVARALSRAPGDRFESAGAFEAALRGYAAGVEERDADAAARHATRRGALVAATGVAAVALAAWWAWPAPREAEHTAIVAPTPEFEVRLYRDTGFGAPVELEPDAAVDPGAWVFLEIEPGANCHSFYVFTQDAAGDSVRVFPPDAPDGSVGEALVWRERLRVPGSAAGEDGFVVLGTDAGEEAFVIAAASGESRWLQAIAEGIPLLADLEDGAAPDERASAALRELRLRGAQGIATAPRAADARSGEASLEEVTDALSSERLADVDAGIGATFRTLTLTNRGR